MEQLASRWLRPGRTSPHDVRLDLLFLLGLCLCLVATGIGLRDPWPADEPRFAQIAREMVASGEWLIPRIGGDLYADKPPLYFWLLALGLSATGSIRASFLLPSFVSALGCVVLVYDLGRRLFSRETGLLAATLLLFTVQFVWQARQAQIDATLCFFITLSLYGLLRHLLLGPSWRWYIVGWAAAGLGVITKGVGFLPLLILIPWALLRARWRLPRFESSAWWWLAGPFVFACAIGAWLVPMLLATSGDPGLAAYRDEILLTQTARRYFDAWHHVEPFWYFLVEVIPILWLPATALLPWLVPRWRAAWRTRQLRIVLPLSWVVLVVLFFSLSTGKRGVYVLPAVPAFVLAVSPYLVELARERHVRRVMFALALAVGAATFVAALYLWSNAAARDALLADYGIDAVGPALAISALALAVSILLRTRGAFLAYAGALASALLVISFWLNPALNDVRSGARFVRTLERAADSERELGLVGFREEHLLNATRPVVHFGHARWREWQLEVFDAARWMSAVPGRQLLVDAAARELCFPQARAQPLGRANRKHWFLVDGAPEATCVARGRDHVARTYVPSRARIRSLPGDEAHQLSADPRTVGAERVTQHGE
ncbi:MAG: glycosyltransferase family 39 protein [Gammaproteobacteria bacterium]|nr:hypothetical protein [Gammaproteobacteria bacterium]